jgi:uncharacterized protein (TIGR02117 family)
MRIINILKIIFFSLILSFEFLIGFITFYIMISLVGMSISIGELPLKKSEITIYLKSDGVHTDFVLPVQTNSVDWSNVFLRSDTKSNDSSKNHISIGWGDQGFFLNTPQWSDLTFNTAFNAAFYRGKSAIHINYINVKDINTDFRELKISKNNYQKLISYIQNSLVKKGTRNYSCIKNRGYWETDAFYESKGSYGLFNTCNSWINEGLKEAELKACLWTPLNSGIFRNYSKN